MARQPRREQDALALALLRAEIALGAAALDRGDFSDVDESDLESYLAGLGPPMVRPPRSKRAR